MGERSVMVKEGDLVAIFNSIHRVMKAESVLKSHGIPMLLIPAPRVLHADCGLAIRYADADRSELERILSDHDLKPEETYVKSGDGYILVSPMKENG